MIINAFINTLRFLYSDCILWRRTFACAKHRITALLVCMQIYIHGLKLGWLAHALARNSLDLHRLTLRCGVWLELTVAPDVFCRNLPNRSNCRCVEE